METFVITILEKIGYLGVFLLIVLESIFPPIPSEIILLFGGFLTTYTYLNIFIIIFVSVLASFLGALLLYFLGSFLNRERIKKIIEGRIGKITRIELEDIDRANEWFNKKGSITIFICRFIPLVRSLISIPAGINKINLFTFSIYTILASFIWNATLVFIGHKLGANWKDVLFLINKYSYLVLSILILSLIFIVLINYKKRKEKKYKS